MKKEGLCVYSQEHQTHSEVRRPELHDMGTQGNMNEAIHQDIYEENIIS